MSISSELGDALSVELSAGTLDYRESGDGEPVVFVHGVFVNGDLWRKVVPHLSGSYRCITPDWPLGSHRTPMRDDADLSTPGLARVVAEFLERLDLNGVTLVGNDTGGAVCQMVAADHPDRIGRLVLTSCDAFETYPPSPFAFLRLIPRLPGAAFLLAQSLRIRALHRLPITYGWVMNELPPRAVVDSYTRPALDRAIRRDATKMLRGISPEHTLYAARRMSDFSRPALLAWGAEDKLFPVELAERLSEVLPDVRRELVPGSRTFVPEDRPVFLAGLIDDFISARPLA